MEREVLAVLAQLPNRGAPICGLMTMVVERSMANLVMGTPGSYLREYPSVKRAVRTLARKGLVRRYSGAKSSWVELSAPVGEERIG